MTCFLGCALGVGGLRLRQELGLGNIKELFSDHTKHRQKASTWMTLAPQCLTFSLPQCPMSGESVGLVSESVTGAILVLADWFCFTMTGSKSPAEMKTFAPSSPVGRVFTEQQGGGCWALKTRVWVQKGRCQSIAGRRG